MKNTKLLLKNMMFMISGIIILIISMSANAQQLSENSNKKLPENFGMYLSSMEGLIKLDYIDLEGSKLKGWSPQKVQNVSNQDFHIISYFTLLTKIPEKFKLYKLQTNYFKPSISVGQNIELSIIPIKGIQGLAGNMVQVVPKLTLTKGNYIIVEDDINKVNQCWIFTIDGGEEMWRKFSFRGWCSSFFSSN